MSFVINKIAEHTLPVKKSHHDATTGGSSEKYHEQLPILRDRLSFQNARHMK